MPDTGLPPPSDGEPVIVEPAIVDPVAPNLSPKPATILLAGLFTLAMLAACYAAAEIVLPVVLAFVLNAVLQPVMRLLRRLRVPRPLAALLLVLGLVSMFAAIGLLLSVPIADRIADLPQTLPKIQQRLHFLNEPIASMQNAMKRIEKLTPGAANEAGQPLAVQSSTPLAERVLQNIRIVAGGGFTTLLVLFFVLMAGEQFIRRLVEILPDFTRKRRVVEISREIEQDISMYLATVTVMNSIVGCATAGMTWLTGLGAPLLWGTVAFLLNFVPILGPTAGVILFLVAGLVTIQPLWAAFLPAFLYLLIHVAEGETITPMLLASRFTVNPVLITIGVIFWYWMWGVVGAILSTPMLAIAKIICDRIESLQPVGHFIGGEPLIFAGNGKAAP